MSLRWSLCQKICVHLNEQLQAVFLLSSSQQKSFSARAVSRSHQRAEHILKNLQQEEEKKRLGREASLITAIPITQEACYEPSCTPSSEQEEEGVLWDQDCCIPGTWEPFPHRALVRAVMSRKNWFLVLGRSQPRPFVEESKSLRQKYIWKLAQKKETKPWIYWVLTRW